MSLESAVLSIAEDLEGFAKEYIDGSIQHTIKMYVKQFRVAVEASKGQSQQPTIISGHESEIEETFKRVMEKKRLEREKDKVKEIDGQGPKMVEIADSGEFIDVPSSMPFGAKTLIMGNVFQLQQDNKLHFLKEETEKLMKKEMA